MKLFLIVLCLSCSLVKCTPAEFTNCPTYSLCINEPVTYQCRVDVSGSANALQWRVFNATGGLLGGSLGIVSYSTTSTEGSAASIGTQFSTNLTSTNGGSLVSDVTFNATMDINNYTVRCIASDTLTPALVGTDTCSIILIEGELYQPTVAPNISAINPDNYTISWPLSTNRCIISYTVFINSPVGNSSYENVPANTGLVVNISQPFNDTVYTISVAAVDTVGRHYRDPVDEIMFIIDVPESVTSLTLNQTGLSIDVSWNEPPDSPRPNVSSYIIYHNVTDSNTNLTVSAPTTTYNIPDAIVGSVYTVGVAAVNVLGTGSFESATISIISTMVRVSTTVPTIHSTTLITTGGITQFTLPSLSISSTKITSPTPTSTCTPSTTEQCSNIVNVLTISFTITVILSVIISSVLSSIITYCCCVSRSVKSYSVTNQSTAATDYEIPMKSSSLEMKDNMAYGHVSVGNRSTSGTTPTVYETVQS